MPMPISTSSVVKSHQEEEKIEELSFSMSEKISSSSIHQHDKKPTQFFDENHTDLTVIPSPPKHSFGEEAFNYLSRIEEFSKTPGYGDEIHVAFRSLRVLSIDWVDDVVTQGLVPDGAPYRYNKVTSLLRFFGDIIRSKGGEVDKLAELEDKLNCLFPDLLDEMYAKLDEQDV